MVDFGQLQTDGSVTNVRTIEQSSILACPFFILAPEHYRADESCRCDDPEHAEMTEWGYIWNANAKRWN